MWQIPRVVPVDIPDGVSGDWEIKTFTVSKEQEDFGKLRAAISFSSRGRYVPAGTYKGLYRHGSFGTTVVMSNTPNEISDHAVFIYRACGSVLINGLGLGVSLRAILDKPEEVGLVDHVTVVEISQDVIDLVYPYFKDRYAGRVEVVRADALQYVAKGSYDCVWHDIWDHISHDNLPSMKRLHRKYGRKCDWQGSWGRIWL